VISPTLAHSSRMSSLISRVAAGSSCKEGGVSGWTLLLSGLRILSWNVDILDYVLILNNVGQACVEIQACLIG